jgi:hypothetical protein
VADEIMHARGQRVDTQVGSQKRTSGMEFNIAQGTRTRMTHAPSATPRNAKKAQGRVPHSLNSSRQHLGTSTSHRCLAHAYARISLTRPAASSISQPPRLSRATDLFRPVIAPSRRNNIARRHNSCAPRDKTPSLARRLGCIHLLLTSG